MEIEPYSIYYNNRPTKIAFLVDPSSTIANSIIEKIITFNRSKWGGNYNPIIYTNGRTISSKWWKLLRDYDPDIVFTTIPLEDSLKKKFKIFLTNFRFEQPHDFNNPNINLDDDPISILPSQSLISKISRDFPEHSTQLALFNIAEQTPDNIRRFIEINFGNYDTSPNGLIHTKKALEGCNRKIFNIIDSNSLNEALKYIGDFRNRLIFASQISSYSEHIKDTELTSTDESFEVIVGNSLNEIVYAWNRPLNLRAWQRVRFGQLWITQDLISDPILNDGLTQFINKYTGLMSNSSNKTKFVSLSIRKSTLERLKKAINRGLFHPRQVIKYTSFPFPEFSSTYSNFNKKRGLQFFRAYSSEEFITIPEPDIPEGGMGGQYWVTDFYIEYRPKNNKTIQGKSYWWQLPKRSNLLNTLYFFNKEARINEEGMFSILMRRKTVFEPDENIVVVKIPEESRIFGNIFCGESYKNIDRTPSSVFSSAPYYTYRTSSMGKPLRGVLSLFSDVDEAFLLIKEKYIRQMFEILSNKRSEKDQKLIDNVSTQLKQKITSGINLTTSTGRIWLAEKVVKISKNVGNKDKEANFNIFLEEAERETNAYNLLHGTTFEAQKDDVLKILSNLIKSNILLCGINAKCPRCGDKNYYHIDNVKQNVVCNGCKYVFTLLAEPSWSYKLNSMVRDAFSEHGVIPVLMVLGQLSMEAKSSFYFIPCTDLIKKTRSGKLKTETDLDIACVIDGKLVIGEVKQSIELFNNEDFDKLKSVAKLLKPDRVIFSSFDQESTLTRARKGLMNRRIAKLQKELKSLEIVVEWYKIHNYIFDPNPVR